MEEWPIGAACEALTTARPFMAEQASVKYARPEQILGPAFPFNPKAGLGQEPV
jgi:hypothetical protein